VTAGQFSAALQSAAWRMNLVTFCAVLDWEQDSYAEQKFREFQDLANALARFDDHTLSTLIAAPGVPV
jgi:hypothetical protein